MCVCVSAAPPACVVVAVAVAVVVVVVVRGRARGRECVYRPQLLHSLAFQAVPRPMEAHTLVYWERDDGVERIAAVRQERENLAQCGAAG